MNIAQGAIQRQQTFCETGEFTSDMPSVVATLDDQLFREAQEAVPGIEAYRAIGVEGLVTAALTHFRKVTGGHSSSILQGTGLRAERLEPDLRAGILSDRHWTLTDNTKTEPTTRIVRPHIDDYFLLPSICYIGIVGQPMLHYPGRYTLDLGRLRDEGFEVEDDIFKLWRSRTDYPSFMYKASSIERYLHPLFMQQIEAAGIQPTESPTDAIFVVTDHFLHSENDHGLAAGSYRGMIRRLVDLSSPLS